VGAFAVAFARYVGFPEAAEEPPEGGAEARRLALVDHVERGGVAVAVEAAEHVAEIAVDVVIEWIVQPALHAGVAHRRMDAALSPALAAGVVERGARGGAVIGAPAVTDELAADMVGDRDQEISLAGIGNDAADLVGKAGRHPLVGVDLDDPFAAAGSGAGSAALALHGPSALDDARAEHARDL